MSKKQDRMANSIQAAINPTLKFLTQPEQEPTGKKPLDDTDERIIELYNAGKNGKEIAAEVGLNPGTVSRRLTRIKAEYPERLHRPEPEAPTQPEPEEAAQTGNAAAENEPGQQDTREAQDTPQTAQKAPEPPVLVQTEESASASQKAENGPQEKPQKAEKKEVFSFRAKVSDKAKWNAYKIAAGETMETIGTAAINEYMERHALTDGKKAIYDAMTANINK